MDERDDEKIEASVATSSLLSCPDALVCFRVNRPSRVGDVEEDDEEEEEEEAHEEEEGMEHEEFGAAACFTKDEAGALFRLIQVGLRDSQNVWGGSKSCPGRSISATPFVFVPVAGRAAVVAVSGHCTTPALIGPSSLLAVAECCGWKGEEPNNTEDDAGRATGA